ncbi:MAG: hypothetical protein M3459_07525 [Actinomycetota bacterium]|nr:hypothetical protein [Actinomycetota bacterium]
MRSWDLRTVDVAPHVPHIISSTEEARAIVLDLPAGERMQEHQVHERTWVVVIEGEVEITAPPEAQAAGGPGLLFELAPQERHEVTALADSRLLLLLAPWPGDGHPGTMTLDEKAGAVAHAAEHARRRA